jgi:hypothetical protein
MRIAPRPVIAPAPATPVTPVEPLRDVRGGAPNAPASDHADEHATGHRHVHEGPRFKAPAAGSRRMSTTRAKPPPKLAKPRRVGAKNASNELNEVDDETPEVHDKDDYEVKRQQVGFETSTDAMSENHADQGNSDEGARHERRFAFTKQAPRRAELRLGEVQPAVIEARPAPPVRQVAAELSSLLTGLVEPKQVGGYQRAYLKAAHRQLAAPSSDAPATLAAVVALVQLQQRQRDRPLPAKVESVALWHVPYLLSLGKPRRPQERQQAAAVTALQIAALTMTRRPGD